MLNFQIIDSKEKLIKVLESNKLILSHYKDRFAIFKKYKSNSVKIVEIRCDSFFTDNFHDIPTYELPTITIIKYFDELNSCYYDIEGATDISDYSYILNSYSKLK
jgi:hypothetical protein